MLQRLTDHILPFRTEEGQRALQQNLVSKTFLLDESVGAVNFIDKLVARGEPPLRRLQDVLGVDGYRFDLASVLNNTCLADCFSFNNFEPQNILNRAVKELPHVRPKAGMEST